jgi:hypothetical protein
MVRAGLYPTAAPRKTESHAELRVYGALAKQLPRGWTAWHSLRMRRSGAADCEADFVIADPGRGLLVLEVKGGHIEQRDGHWYSNKHPLAKAPRDQAKDFVHVLLDRLKAIGVAPPACGVATAFPDTPFSNQPTEGDLDGCVLGQQDLAWFDKALNRVMVLALPEGKKPKGKWIDAVHALWSENWVPRLNLGDAAGARREELLRLDREQWEILQGLEENQRVLIEGGAGTGKTILAHASARRLAEQGRKVLLLCFTEALAHWLSGENPHPNLTVRPIKRYAVELLEQAGETVVLQDSAEFWREATLRAIYDALAVVQPGWDAVVVDEGQDLTADDWDLIAELSRERRLWAFYDTEQAFWRDRRVREELFTTRYRLTKAYRCPKEIETLAGWYLGRAADAALIGEAVKSETIAVRGCPSRTSVPEKIGTEIDKLLRDGLKPEEIAVLSLRGKAESGSVIHADRLGNHRVVRADDPEATRHVIAETFLRFKGLERPAIVVTDIHLAHEKQDYPRRMYIALTRALASVRIVDSREDLERDALLAGLMKGVG